MPKAPEDPQSRGVGRIKGRLGSPRWQLLSLCECEFGLQRLTQTQGTCRAHPIHGEGGVVLGSPVQPSVDVGAHFDLVSLARLGAKGGQRAHLLRFLQARPGPCATEGTRSWEARSLSRNFPAGPACGAASSCPCVPITLPVSRVARPIFFCPHRPPLTVALLATLSACLSVPVLPPSLSYSIPVPDPSLSPGLLASLPASLFSCAGYLLFCCSLSLFLSHRIGPSLHVEVHPEGQWVPPDAWPSLRWASRADLKFLEAVRPRLLLVILLGHLTDAPPRKTVAQ